MTVLKQFILAWQFLTVLPGLKTPDVTPGDWGRSMGYYPLVGLILGAVLWLFWNGLSTVFPSAVVDFFVVMLLVGLTGALHLDGLADAADGLLGGGERESALKIMRDPHIGSFGVIALIAVILAKYLALFHLPCHVKGLALLGMPALGRWSIVCISSFSEYARKEGGLAQPFIEHCGWKQLVWASLTAAMISWFTFGLEGLSFLFFAGLVSLGFLWYFKKKIGGVTGDCLGAVAELTEVIFLFMVLTSQSILHD